ncbi:serine hydrolase [Hyphococcus flavus]|uniref:Serine hydrolase n=1 Tax=Hyphococcus flavus TaxID=1866326 RepID=A0AAE9ZGH2_9PROT|nr:serine hydrolase domain-containing protein [Hyphococcus flavus]WDI32538.1 serine hydrolase [Hyphococcus flavus]
MRSVSIVCAVLAALFSSIAGAQEPPDPAPTTPVDTVSLPAFEPTREEAVLEGYVDGVVRAHMRAHGTPGVAVSVVMDGRLVFAKGYGAADAALQRPVTGDGTLFRIGSVSKTFIWTSVMLLRDRGLLDLDTDVNEYLEGVQIPDAFGGPITMNHLMAHRAGFEDTFSVFTYRDDSNETLAEALNDTMPKRVYPAGARTSYSNWGSALAAKIVEDVSGVSFEDFLMKEILMPIEMANTTLKGPSTIQANLKSNLAEGVKFSGGAYAADEYMQIGPFAPAGAMASTAEDMAQWMLLHLGGGATGNTRLLSPQSHELMWSRAFSDREAGSDLAHGFMTGFHRGVETFSHGGATSTFYTNMVLVPDLSLGLFISQNATTDRTLVSDLPALVMDHLLAETSIAESPALNDVESPGEYTGQYFANRRSFTQFEKLFSASDLVTVAPGQNNDLIITRNGNAYSYKSVPEASGTFENLRGERVVFGRDQSGKVSHISDASGVHSFDRPGIFNNSSVFNFALGAAFLFSVTTMLGAWRRQGRPSCHKAVGVWLNRADIIIAMCVFIFAGLGVATAATLVTASASALLEYPPVTIVALRVFGLILFVMALGLLISAPLAWTRSGWSAWRKAHHTIFALSMVVLAIMLVAWRVIFSATA